MHILVTNDDGVQVPGLQALAQALKPYGKLTVLAPDRNWSASGHVKTLDRPLRVRETQLDDGTPALVTDGAPSDCVALAALGLLDTPVDLVASGINPHANLGQDVTYSGTVTAAMEALICGIPAFAISLDTPENHQGEIDFHSAANAASKIIGQILQHGLDSRMLLNINLPYLPLEDIRGLAITRQGHRVYRDALDRRVDPRGRPYYWIGGEAPTGVPEEGTDIWALDQGLVSVTPLQLDLTCQSCMAILKRWDLKL